MSSKNKLQERLQRQGRGLPTYMCTKNGPDHAPRFIATVKLDNGQTFQSPGFCSTMKQAENAAADAALDALKNQDQNPVKPNGGPLTVQKQVDEGSSNLQKEAKKKDSKKLLVANSETKEETLQHPEIMPFASKSSMATMLENNELKNQMSQTVQCRPQSFPNSAIDVFPSSRIQIVSLQRFPTSENLQKGSNKQNVDSISSMPEISGMGTNKGQGHNMVTCMLEKGQQNEKNIQQSEESVLTSRLLPVQNQTDEGLSNLQEEAKKNDRMTIVVANGERKEETLQQPENVPSSSKLTMATMWENNQLKDETSQTTQCPRTFPSSAIDVLPSSRIQIVPLQRFTISENSGKGSNKQNVDNMSSMPEQSGNGINKEQGHNMATLMLEKWQQNDEIIQQSEKITSTPQFLPDMHKNQLQEYAVRRGFDYPCYSCIREGPAHAPRFKAMVKFDGETFESPGFFNTLRLAEHAAAAVALKSLSDIGPYLDESSMCKSLLQDKAQKEGNPLPEYNTTKSGPSHMPLFTCTVKFNEMIFEGKAAKTKKQAEKNAASVAWSALKHSRRSSSTLQDKPKALVGKLNNPPHVEVINHMKEETDSQSHGQLSHLGTGHSAVSHSESSEAFNTASKKEMGQNITASVLENRGNDQVLCPSKRLSPPKHSEGTRIRVMPVPDSFKKWPLDSSDLSSSGKPWVAVNLTEPPNHEKYK